MQLLHAASPKALDGSGLSASDFSRSVSDSTHLMGNHWAISSWIGRRQGLLANIRAKPSTKTSWDSSLPATFPSGGEDDWAVTYQRLRSDWDWDHLAILVFQPGVAFYWLGFGIRSAWLGAVWLSRPWPAFSPAAVKYVVVHFQAQTNSNQNQHSWANTKWQLHASMPNVI